MDNQQNCELEFLVSNETLNLKFSFKDGHVAFNHQYYHLHHQEHHTIHIKRNMVSTIDFYKNKRKYQITMLNGYKLAFHRWVQPINVKQ